MYALFDAVRPLVGVALGLKDLAMYVATAVSACLATATVLHRLFRSKSAAEIKHRKNVEASLDSAKRLISEKDDEITELQGELERSSADRVLKEFQGDIADGNDGRAFDRLATFMSDNRDGYAKIAEHLARVRLSFELAKTSIGNVQEAYQFACVAHFLCPDQQSYRSLHDELGVLFSAQSLENGESASQHEVFDWLHLREPAEVEAMVAALTKETIREMNNAHYEVGCATIEAGYRMARRRLGVSSEITRGVEALYIQCSRQCGRLSEAQELAEDAWNRSKRDKGDLASGATGYQLAFVYYDQAKFEEAERLARIALAMFNPLTSTVAGDMKILTTSVLSNALAKQGKLLEAEALLREVSDRGGEPNTASLSIEGSLGIVLTLQGRHIEGEVFLRQAWEKGQQLFPYSPEMLHFGNLLTICLIDCGRLDDAKVLAQSILDMARERFPKGHWFIYLSEGVFARCLEWLGRHAEAEPLARDSLLGLTQTLGPSHRTTLDCVATTADILVSLGKFTEAEPLARQVWMLDARGISLPSTLLAGNALARCLLASDMRVEALKITEKLSDFANSHGYSNHNTLIESLRSEILLSGGSERTRA